MPFVQSPRKLRSPSICDSDSECSTRCPSPEREPSRSSVIIFDWDDTLLPTSFLEANGARAGNFPAEVFASVLKAHAEAVEQLLRAAARTSRVALVTLGKRDWVAKSAAAFLPDLHIERLLKELDIPVYYARAESPRQPSCHQAKVQLKRDAMARALTEASSKQAGDRLDVLSIGDSSIEREAIRELLTAWSRLLAQVPLCKTIKLLEKPDLSSLTQELQQLESLLPRLVIAMQDLDMTIEAA